MEFSKLLVRLAQAVETRDADLLADCFTADGIYEDYFYGAKQGRDGLREMLEHFYAGARDFRWEFLQPVSDGKVGYAAYRFSYTSLQSGAEGRRVAFEGISCCQLRDGRIARYREVFDRGLALVQQDFAAERIARIESRYAGVLRDSPEWSGHFQP